MALKPFLCIFVVAPVLLGQAPGAPARTFATHCTICHGGDANGTDRAPAILGFVASHADEEIAALVRTGRVDKGMPRFDFSNSEMKALIAHLRGLATGAVQPALSPGRGGRGGRGGGPFQPRPASLKLQDGRTLQGTLTSSTSFSATLLTPDGKFHLLG